MGRWGGTATKKLPVGPPSFPGPVPAAALHRRVTQAPCLERRVCVYPEQRPDADMDWQECKCPVVVVSRTPATAGKVPGAASLADMPIVGGVERIVIGSDLHPSYITAAALHDSSCLAHVSHCQIITFSA